MNILERQVAEFIAKSNGQTLPPSVVVSDFTVEELRGEPDYILAWLSNGKILTVRWEGMQNRLKLTLAESDAAPDVEVKESETGISKSSLNSLIDLARDKYETWVAEDAPYEDPNEEGRAVLWNDRGGK